MATKKKRETTQADKDRLKALKVARDKMIEEATRPLRIAMLKELPREGSKLGYQIIGATTKQLERTLNQGLPREGWIPGSQLMVQMRILRERGYVVAVPVYPLNKGFGWQITPAGEKWLDQQTQTEEEKA